MLDTRAPAEKKEIDCGGSLLLSNKPVSFTEGGLWLPALPGASSISVMDGCGALHRVPVNFNYIDLPPSRVEVSAGFVHSTDILRRIESGSVLGKQRPIRIVAAKTFGTLKLVTSSPFQLLHKTIFFKFYAKFLEGVLYMLISIPSLRCKQKPGVKRKAEKLNKKTHPNYLDYSHLHLTQTNMNMQFINWFSTSFCTKELRMWF